jgi:hypothetical protein
MRTRGRSSKPSVAACALAAMLLCAGGSARAGGGGEDVGGVQAVLNMICQVRGTSCQVPLAPLPTITQLVLEIAGLSNEAPNLTRSELSICDFPGGPNCASLVVNAVNKPTQPPVLTNPNLAPAASCVVPSSPSNICPLAFISSSTGKGQAVAAQPGNQAADTFLYAVTAIAQGAGQPDTLSLVYDYLPRTLPFFIKDRVLGRISLPLVELLSDSSGSERLVAANLEISTSCNGGTSCLTATIIGDFTGSGTPQKLSTADLGLTFKASFGASPNSKTPHTIFEVDIPLLVTQNNDPPYFTSSSPPGIFSTDAPGFLLGGTTATGAAPDAAPVAASFSPSVAEDEGNLLPFVLRPSVKGSIALGISGAVLASAPLP